MRNFLRWLAEAASNITVSVDSFKQKLDQLLEELISFHHDEADRLKKLNFDLGYLIKLIPNYPEIKTLVVAAGSPEFTHEMQRFKQWMDSNGEMESNRKAFWYLYDYDKSLRGDDPQWEFRVRRDHISLINETQKNMDIVKSIIETAINRVEHWNGSSIVITAMERSSTLNKIDYLPAEDAHIYIGKASFTLFMDQGKISGVDDILEDEEDFFTSENAKSDYYNLVKELKDPGSTSQGMVLTLYTARPTKDRGFYSQTKTLPANIFLTNNASHAEGLARDLSSDEPRDVWMVKINSKYLLQTLDANGIQYFMVNVPNAPIVKISPY